MSDLVERLRKRADIRRQIATRKSVQEGKADRISDLLEEAAVAIETRKDYDELQVNYVAALKKANAANALVTDLQEEKLALQKALAEIGRYGYPSKTCSKEYLIEMWDHFVNTARDALGIEK